MKIKSMLSVAFGAIAALALALPVMAQDSPTATGAMTMDALSMRPPEGASPENIDGTRVNAKVQNEAAKILADYRRASVSDVRGARVSAIGALERLLRTDGANLSVRSFLGYLLLGNNEPKRAAEVIAPAAGKSQYEETNASNWTNLALAHYLSANYAAATDAYIELSKLSPLSVGAARFAGSAALLAGRNDQAIIFLEQVKGSSLTGDERNKALRDLATAFVRTGRNGDAVMVYEELNAAGDNSTEVLSWMGYTYLKEKQFDKAISALEKARSQSANDVAVLTNLGNAYLGRGTDEDNRKAVEVYTRLSEVAPNNPVAPYNLGVLRMKAEQWEPAAASFRRATSLAGNRSESRFAWNNLGFCLEKLGRHADSAAAYARASDLDTSSGIFARNAGMAYTRANDSANARKYLDRARAAGATGGTLDSSLIENMVREGRTAEALRMLQAQAEADSSNADVWFNIGVLSQRTNDLARAEAAYRKANELKPDDADTLRNLGVLLLEQGKEDEAVTLLEKMVGAYPASVEGKKALAAAYVKAGRLSDAVTQYREIVRLEPQNADARLNLADGLWNLGQTKDARFHYSTVLRSQPNNARANNGIGLWHLLQSDARSAEAAFRRAMNADSRYLPSYNNLAIALERLNRRAEAILVLKRALGIDPNFQDARTNLNRLENPVNMQA